MNNSAMPLRLTVVFAASGDRNSIPTESTSETLSDGKASFDVGFPPLTRIALSSGGKPPQGQDFNGIFYESFLRHNGVRLGVDIHLIRLMQPLLAVTQKGLLFHLALSTGFG